MKKSELRYLFVYYSVLLFILIVMDRMEAPSIILRIAYLLSFSLPVVIICPQHFPALLITYMAIGTNHFAFTFFPYDMNYYPVLAAMGLLLVKQKAIKSTPPYCLLVFSFLIFFVDIITAVRIESVFYSFLTLILLSCYLNKFDDSQKVFFANMLCVMALIISYVYLTNYKNFLTDYAGPSSGLKRGGWSDPNYLACTIGAGVMASLTQVLDYKKVKVYYRWLFVFTIGVSVIAMVVMASRGALLSLSLGTISLILMSNTNKKVKVQVITCIVLFVIYLMNSSYVDLLEYRLETESGDGGNGRFDIWKFKIDAFFGEGNILNLLFGYGYNGSLYLGGRGYWAIHNDFVALLCDYGLIGLSLFLYMLYYPIKIANSNSKMKVFALLLYLVLCCCSLEPFSAGRLPFFGYYLFILCVAKSEMYNNSSFNHEYSTLN